MAGISPTEMRTYILGVIAKHQRWIDTAAGGIGDREGSPGSSSYRTRLSGLRQQGRHEAPECRRVQADEHSAALHLVGVRDDADDPAAAASTPVGVGHACRRDGTHGPRGRAPAETCADGAEERMYVFSGSTSANDRQSFERFVNSWADKTVSDRTNALESAKPQASVHAACRRT